MIRLLLFFTFFLTVSASAQNVVWIQVEAQPTLTSAQNRVRAYAAQVENVAGGRGPDPEALGSDGRRGGLQREIQRAGAVQRVALKQWVHVEQVIGGAAHYGSDGGVLLGAQQRVANDERGVFGVIFYE